MLKFSLPPLTDLGTKSWQYAKWYAWDYAGLMEWVDKNCKHPKARQVLCQSILDSRNDFTETRKTLLLEGYEASFRGLVNYTIDRTERYNRVLEVESLTNERTPL